jgi:hypothetical protein
LIRISQGPESGHGCVPQVSVTTHFFGCPGDIPYISRYEDIEDETEYSVYTAAIQILPITQLYDTTMMQL